MVTKSKKFLQASITPVQDLDAMAFPGELAHRRMYRSGYEKYFNALPVLNGLDPFLNEKVQYSKSIMDKLAKEVIADGVLDSIPVNNNDMNRVILALESPEMAMVDFAEDVFVKKSGAEVVVGMWGKGFSTPVHGHAAGFMYESLIKGKLLLNTYRLIDSETGIVRLIKSEVVTKNTISKYNEPKPDKGMAVERTTNIHNFVTLEESITLHYFSEHVRNARNNTFAVEYFDDVYDLTGKVKRISTMDGMYLRCGDVVLVNSINNPDYGKHYAVVTGGITTTEHGQRVEHTIIEAKHNVQLDAYAGEDVVILKLNQEATEAFFNFHGITKEGNQIIFPS